MTENLSKSKWRRFQTGVLFLLVGTNPLPNYVAGCLLTKPEGTIVLLATEDTYAIADRLKQILQAKGKTENQNWNISEPREIAHTDASRIHSKVSELIREYADEGSMGLNYTGGTKAMAVHAYRAIADERPDAVFSYLDARELAMRIERLDAPIRVKKVGTDCRISLGELMQLHGRRMKDPITKSWFPKVANTLAKLHQDKAFRNDWRQWCNQNLRRDNRPDKFKSKQMLREVPIPQDEPLKQVFQAFEAESFTTLGDLELLLRDRVLAQGATKWSIKHLAEWLDGKWLEDYVLDAFQEIAAEVGLHEVAMNIEAAVGQTKFEFDVAAIRGYQLFAVSCTTSTSKGLCKSKLFEAYLRSHQMGGDEAHTALVSMYDDPAKLKSEIEESWFTQGHVEAFGPGELVDLSEHLKQWVRTSARL